MDEAIRVAASTAAAAATKMAAMVIAGGGISGMEDEWQKQCALTHIYTHPHQTVNKFQTMSKLIKFYCCWMDASPQYNKHTHTHAYTKKRETI